MEKILFKNWCIYCKDIIEENDNYVYESGNFYHLDCYKIMNNWNIEEENYYNPL